MLKQWDNFIQEAPLGFCYFEKTRRISKTNIKDYAKVSILNCILRIYGKCLFSKVRCLKLLYSRFILHIDSFKTSALLWVHRRQTQSKVSTIDEQYPKVMNPRNEALLERSRWIAVRKPFLKKGNKQKSLTNDIFG